MAAPALTSPLTAPNKLITAFWPWIWLWIWDHVGRLKALALLARLAGRTRTKQLGSPGAVRQFLAETQAQQVG